MIDKLKKKWYRFGVLVCSDMNEVMAAKEAINTYGGDTVDGNSWWGKTLINGMVSPMYKACAFAFVVYNGHNFDNCVAIANKFQADTNGFQISQNPAVANLM